MSQNVRLSSQPRRDPVHSDRRFLAWERALPALRALPIDETLRFGIDLGEASCGLAALQIRGNQTGEIAFLGVRLFDSALEPNTKVSKNAVRRHARATRRRLRARRRRIADLRRALAKAGLPHDPDTLARALPHIPVRRPPNLSDSLWSQIQNAKPWLWRAEGLDHPLPPDAWAHVLLHLALHRGYKAKTKGERLILSDPPADTPSPSVSQPAVGNSEAHDNATTPQTPQKTKDAKAEDLGKVRNAAHTVLDGLRQTGRRTVGEWMAREILPHVTAHHLPLRNRHGSYARIALRDLIRAEARALFDAQRRLGNPYATSSLEHAVLAALTQKTPRGVAHLVGPCPFLPNTRRTARHAPSAEAVVAFQRVQCLQVINRATGHARPLTTQEIQTLVDLLRKQTTPPRQSKALQALRLDPTLYALLVPSRNASANKQTKRPRKTSKTAKTQAAAAEDAPILPGRDTFQGTRILEKVLGPKAFARASPALLDRIAEAVAFSASTAELKNRLAPHPGAFPELPHAFRRRILHAFDAGRFDSFTGTAAASGKALRAILSHLRKGHDFYEAQRRAFPKTDLTLQLPNGHSPQARRALREALAQIAALCRHLGRRPGTIVVELSRDLARSPETKAQIKNSQQQNKTQKEHIRKSLQQQFPTIPPTDAACRRYDLWTRQNGLCIYTGQPISPDILFDKTRVHLDHIVPRSRGGDDETANLVLCLATANSAKMNQTPFQWLGGDPEVWRAFRARVEGSTLKDKTKRRLLDQRIPSETEQDEFRNRQLHDTMAASRALLAHVQALWCEDDARPLHGAGEQRRATATPGRLTGLLRHLWGLNRLKYLPQPPNTKSNPDKTPKRVEDPRHHAADAAIVATLDHGLLQRLSEAFKARERAGLSGLPDHFSPPWATFPQDLVHHLEHKGPFEIPRPDRPEETFRPILPSVQLSRRARGGIHKDTLYAPVRSTSAKRLFFETFSVPPTVKPSDVADLQKKIQDAMETLGILPGSQEARSWEDLLRDLERWHNDHRRLSEALQANPMHREKLLAEIKALVPRRGSPTGPIIRRIRIPVQKSCPLSVIRSGRVEAFVENDNGSIVRTDVYRADTPVGKSALLFVPVYRSDVYDRRRSRPPEIAATENGPQSVSKSQFRLSLYAGDLIRISRPDERTQVMFAYSFNIAKIGPTFLHPLLIASPEKNLAIRRTSILEIARTRLNRLGLPESDFKSGPETRIWHGQDR